MRRNERERVNGRAAVWANTTFDNLGSIDWLGFWRTVAKELQRLQRDGIRLSKRADFVPSTYASNVQLPDKRLTALSAAEPDDGDTRHLTNRPRKHMDHIFTFLDYDNVPFENNFAEHQIRPTIILNKNS